MKAFTSKKTNGRPKTKRWGATAVEMAFALPILLLIVFGVFEFTRIYMVQQIMQNVSRVGCRNAVIEGSTNTIIEGEATESLERFGIRGAEVTLFINGQKNEISNAGSGDQITLQIVTTSSAVSIVPHSFFKGSLIAKSSRRKF